MPFILSAQSDDPPAAWARYQQYLASERERFPPLAYGLATSGWYHNFSDHRCPHDAWLEEFAVTETRRGAQPGDRRLSIRMRLLGAYHDGHIEIRYPQVFAYELALSNGERGHSDWRYDEFRVNDEGHLVHEIEWWGPGETGRWIIVASDIEFSWHPFQDDAAREDSPTATPLPSS